MHIRLICAPIKFTYLLTYLLTYLVTAQSNDSFFTIHYKAQIVCADCTSFFVVIWMEGFAQCIVNCHPRMRRGNAFSPVRLCFCPTVQALTLKALNYRNFIFRVQVHPHNVSVNFIYQGDQGYRSKTGQTSITKYCRHSRVVCLWVESNLVIIRPRRSRWRRSGL